jgi:hypothetical protein
MKALRIFVLVGLLAVMPWTAVAEENDDSTNETFGSIEIGGLLTDVDGSPDKAAEYYTTDEGPVGKVKLSTYQDWGSFDFGFKYMASDENQGYLDFDVKRMVRSHNDYIKHPHRFGHDPMANLVSTSVNNKVVYKDDLAPTQIYGVDYALFHDRTELQFPSVRALTLAVEYRDQTRSGHTQAFTTSHCDACHVTSRAHPRNESTTDATLEALVGFKSGSIRARFTSRELSERYNTIDTTFDKNLHPELRLPVFDNRMQYDSDVGAVPADLKPDIDKDIARLDFRWASRNGLAITANGVWAETENQYTGNSSDYTGYVATVTKRFKSNLRLRWRGKVYQTDTASVYVDPIQRTSPAGPQAGQTYFDVYGQTFDQFRNSALNRDALQSKLDASFRFGRKAGTVRALWYYDYVDREFYEVLPGEKKTTTNRLGLSYRMRPMKGLRIDAALNHAEVDNAFMLINGACSTLVSEPWPNPWNPDTPQYQDFQAARIAETTASASSWTKAELGLAWLTGSTTISGKYVYWDGDNNDGDLTDWSKERNSLTLTAWTPGGADWDWYLSYAYQDMSLDVPLCIPVFDG